MRLLIISAILVLLITPTILAEPCSCNGEYQIFGSSFNVHGRLSFWNGNPSRRIWIIGTKRMLGVREETPLPENIDKLLVKFDDEIYGDFVVCPLTKSKKGSMQIVCVQSANNLIKKKRK
jgi:hypothetical protein